MPKDSLNANHTEMESLVFETNKCLSEFVLISSTKVYVVTVLSDVDVWVNRALDLLLLKSCLKENPDEQ
jgi:hypothetical protein